MLLNAAAMPEFRRAIRLSENETAEPYPNKPSVALKIAVAIGCGAPAAPAITTAGLMMVKSNQLSAQQTSPTNRASRHWC
jgi:hypothetical protein